MSNMSNVRALRVVEGGLARPGSRPVAKALAARASTRDSRWMDFMPMALLGLSAGIAGVMQVVSAVAR